jgi:hypothetical protein
MIMRMHVCAQMEDRQPFQADPENHSATAVAVLKGQRHRCSVRALDRDGSNKRSTSITITSQQRLGPVARSVTALAPRSLTATVSRAVVVVAAAAAAAAAAVAALPIHKCKPLTRRGLRSQSVHHNVLLLGSLSHCLRF